MVRGTVQARRTFGSGKTESKGHGRGRREWLGDSGKIPTTRRGVKHSRPQSLGAGRAEQSTRAPSLNRKSVHRASGLPGQRAGGKHAEVHLLHSPQTFTQRTGCERTSKTNLRSMEAAKCLPSTMVCGSARSGNSSTPRSSSDAETNARIRLGPRKPEEWRMCRRRVTSLGMRCLRGETRGLATTSHRGVFKLRGVHRPVAHASQRIGRR